MEDQTTTISKSEQPEVKPQTKGQVKVATEDGPVTSSHVMSISIRGWIALLITITFCTASISRIDLDDTMKITVTAVISLYFGQNQKNSK